MGPCRPKRSCLCFAVMWYLIFHNSPIFCRLDLTTPCDILYVMTQHLLCSERSVVPRIYCHLCGNRFPSVTGWPEWEAIKTLIFLCTQTESCQFLPFNLFLQHILSSCTSQLHPLQPFVLTQEVTICTTRFKPKILNCS